MAIKYKNKMNKMIIFTSSIKVNAECFYKPISIQIFSLLTSYKIAIKRTLYLAI